MDQVSTLPNFLPSQAVPRVAAASSPGAGAISGDLLRPGAIDQPQFKAMLQAAQAAQQTGAGPPAPPSQASIINGIPNLTPAQFAALTGGQAIPGAKESVQYPTTPSPDDVTAASQAKTESSGRAEPDAAAPASPTPPDAAAPKESDPRVVHFKRMPDQDERRALTASGKRWVVDETPGSRELFFGDDQVFGWDDFVDLINPLQHIPVVAQIYRAVSGDKINGAAELLGALPFGPTSFIASVADLAVRDSTGKDMGSNAIAMLFGKDAGPAEEASTAERAAPAPALQTSAVPDDDHDRDNGGRDA